MKIKRWLSFICVVTLLVSVFALPVNASTTLEGTNGAAEATDDQITFWNSQEKADVSYANRSEDEVLAGVSSNARAVSWLYTSRYFYYYGQEKNYSCGPACVKMALKNITGTAYSESVIRTGCKTTTSGTYLSDMVQYLNDMQDHNSYIARYQKTKFIMKRDLYSCIVNWDSPPIIGVKENTSNGWNYNLNAHFVIVYAVRSDNSAFMISDPWSGYIGDSGNRDLNISCDDLFTGYNAVNIGYMY